MQSWKPSVRSKFFTVRELILYSIVFIGVCIIIYPGRKIERYILTPERRNIELSIIYTRNILRIWDNPVLRVHLVDNLIQAGMLEDAEEEARKLMGTPYEDRAYFALYKIEKFRYFAKGSSRIDLMQEYLTKALRASKDKKFILEIYKEAVLMNIPYVAMVSAEELYKLEEDIFWLREAYRYAVGLGHIERALNYAIELYKKDIKQREKYKQDLAYMLLNSKEGKLLLEKYKDIMGESLYAEILIRMEPRMVTSAQMENLLEKYMELFMTTKDYNERRKLFINIVQMYLWKGDYEGAKAFIDKYYGEFINDKEMALFILKSALATGDTFFAQKIAQNIKEKFVR